MLFRSSDRELAGVRRQGVLDLFGSAVTATGVVTAVLVPARCAFLRVWGHRPGARARS
jgi:hypothetical protein